MAKKRVEVPKKIAILILVANRHTCCICREKGKHVVIHHIDEDPSNNDPDNLYAYRNRLILEPKVEFELLA